MHVILIEYAAAYATDSVWLKMTIREGKVANIPGQGERSSQTEQVTCTSGSRRLSTFVCILYYNNIISNGTRQVNFSVEFIQWQPCYHSFLYLG